MTIQQTLKDPCASYWLKDAIRAAQQRDPLDALRDAETLAALLRDAHQDALRREAITYEEDHGFCSY